jgi:aldehyde:ferredoxin oxidoreductase
MTHKGYAGNILVVDLSNGDFSKIPTQVYSKRFLGGRGIASGIYFDEMDTEIDAFDSRNPLIFISGPVCGFPGFAGSRWQICGKSPLGDRFSYSNLGGSWGAKLKFSGYDGVVVKGRADKLVYLYIDDNTVDLRGAEHLKGKGAIQARDTIKADIGKSTGVAAIGPAGEHLVKFATVLSDADSSGAGGFGAVMGSKNLKAVAVRGNGKIEAAYPERVKELRFRLRHLKQSNVIMDTPIAPPAKLKKNVCYGCISGCWRADYTAEDGQKGKYMCQSGFFYISDALKFDRKEKDVPFKANKLCDDYGLDSRVIDTMIQWLKACFEEKILNDENSGLPLSKIGSIEFIEDLIEKISFREGFGDILAEGTLKASDHVGNESDKLITDYMVKTGELDVYGPRLYNTNGLFYATEPRAPIQHLHEISMQLILWAFSTKGVPNVNMTSEVLRAIAKRFWGSEVAADFSVDEGKALAAAKIQDRQYAYESMILCNFSWPIIHLPGVGDGVGDPTLESQICSAITGMEMDELELYKTGERVFNLQRAILALEGWKGREEDSLEGYNYSVPLKSDVGNDACIVPGKDGEVFSRKGMVVKRDEFEKLKDEYYEIRGWDVASGFQTRDKLLKLDLADVADRLEPSGMLL